MMFYSISDAKKTKKNLDPSFTDVLFPLYFRSCAPGIQRESFQTSA